MIRSLSVLFVCFLLSLSTSVFANPSIPREKIPASAPEEVKKQLERLYSDDYADRGSAAFYLRKMGEKAVPAMPFLISNLPDEGDNCGDSCDHIHAPSGHDHVTPGEEAEKTLIELSRYSLEPLLEAASDKDLEVRRRVIRILGVVKDPRAVKPLTAAMNDENPNVRMMAGWSLALIGDGSVDPLIGVLQDKKSISRGDAAWALGNIKNTKAVEPLISALGEGDPVLSKDAHNALKKISGKEFGPDPKEWREWWEKEKVSSEQ